MKILLRIEFRSQARHEPVAWFIPGGNSAEWLEEITLWQVETQSLVLYVIAEPASDDARLQSDKVCGVLVTGRTAIRPKARHLARPWGCVADRLYLPVEAAIVPPVEEHEIVALLPEGELLAWHPRLGLLGFEAEQQLSIADLLSPPREAVTQWDRAEPGPVFAKRLASLTAEKLPDVESAIDGGQDDIATETDSLDELPPTADETCEGAVRRAFEDFRKAIARKVRSLTSKAPRSAKKPTWIDGLDDWANQVLDSSILRKRTEALNRLLSLLDHDPEAGLRKALPFGDEPHRGRARPGAELGEREIDFRMPGQSGDGPADYWEVPWEIHQQLLTKYRELANREVQLGRHRRAAYIFGNLLGDHYAAARTLEEGGHYLEAATLHRDRLGQPLEAARCLERGGVLHQAIEIYERHAWFEDAARLHEKLEQTDEAHECWSKAVKSARANRNYLHAAKLTREKLDEPDQALVILRSGWDQSTQAKDCLSEWFRLSGELGQHDQAASHANELGRDSRIPGRATELVQVLAGVSSSYPDAAVRQQSADSARQVVSRELESRSVGRLPLLTALREVDRSDRLLARDCDRYGQVRLAASRSVKPASSSRFLEIEEIAARKLGQLEELVVACSDRSLFLAGYHAAVLRVRRFEWEMLLQSNGEDVDASGDVEYRVPICLRPMLAAAPSNVVVVHVPGNTPPGWARRRFADSTSLWTGGPRWLRKDGTLAVAWDRGGFAWHVARDESDLRLECFSADGSLVSSLSLVPVIDDPVASHMLTQVEDLTELNIGLIAAHNRCFLRIGNNVYIIGPGAASDFVQMDSSIFDMAVSPELTRLELAVSSGRGVYVYPAGQWFAPDILMTELRRPKICYTRDGLLVGADGDACIVADTQGQQVARLEWSHREFPVAVVPTHLPVTFAVVFADGLVRILRVT